MFTRNEDFKTFIHLYPIVTAICFIQVILWGMLQIPYPFFTLLFGLLSGYNGGIEAGEWWRLASPIFLHASFSHLLFNTIALILFAPPLERILKSAKFALVYLITGIVANIATFIIEPAYYIHVGASGAIYGLFGMYVFMAFYRQRYMDKRHAQLILTILFIGLVMTFLSPNTNVVAHLSGLIAGFAVTPLFIKKNSFNH
ncbi:rhomboid family intramembrane serine protease [Bacillus sp. FJAT-47783]|uniref:rhomboid family intramembrane serine protease n=1 Tax=Bacillus sp. FJAT-47783 TaxID=2922712 RepID=UPI001FAD6C4A|nr:rhomboid family intramembrane serine protease [Bacillus sp. FJAT-47783]